MNTPVKPSGLQMYQNVVYSRAIHPELFALKARRVHHGGSYDLESWLMNGAHLLRFEHNSLCACEVLISHDSKLPENGVVNSFLCTGEHEYEHLFSRERANYMTTVQTETLSENAYAAAFDEYRDFARKNHALVHQWPDDGGKCLSIVDVQTHSREVHSQSYHLVAASGLFLRSQTIFELI